MVELGEEMIRRGHQIKILTSEAFRQLAESKEVQFFKLDTDADHVMKYLVTDYMHAHGMFKYSVTFFIGLSSNLAYRLFFDNNFTVSHAWFDGVALCKNAGFAEQFMKKLFKSRKKKLAKNHVEASSSLVKMYGYDFAKMMTKNFERITVSDIDAICHACCHYDLRPLTDEEQKKLHLDFGEKDFDWKYSKKTIPVYMPKAEVTIRPGYPHCGYMAAETEEYVRQIEAFMRRA